TPVFIVTPEEAKKNEQEVATGKKTWIFKADNVRDFAFASSRKFIWDAQLHRQESGEPVWAMSYYPNEAEPLWSKYSTHAVIHTLEVYSKFTFDYPYPVAISVNGPVFGMEYPMICFNGPRPEKDGTYSARTKYALIGVVIHEVGHNYFPMIVNSDERQWTWMDEGLNTFVQFLAEQEWEEKYAAGRGRPSAISSYMSGSNTVPIMTNSESLKNFGANAYAKPSSALNVLRETVMGRENFDFAFKQYSQRWMFKRPTPADFFRTMEDASGVDLDWFWRGWFYTTNHVDIGIGKVKVFQIDTRNPETEKGIKRDKKEEAGDDRVDIENREAELPRRTDRFPDLLDFYNEFDELDVTDKEREEYHKLLKDLSKEEKKLLSRRDYFYVVEFENVGGLVMPIIVEVKYEDGSKEIVRVPAEIWKQNSKTVSKLIVAKHKIASLKLDPMRETADADALNNRWPQRAIEGRIRLKKDDKDKSNPMREAREAAEKKSKEKEEKEGEASDKKASGSDEPEKDGSGEGGEDKPKKKGKGKGKKKAAA
ncbi:MAG: M1 family aminopeptidase, partial [Verrucomicrobiales bacterium]